LSSLFVGWLLIEERSDEAGDARLAQHPVVRGVDKLKTKRRMRAHELFELPGLSGEVSAVQIRQPGHRAAPVPLASRKRRDTGR